MVATPKIKVRKRDSNTHTHPTLETQAHMSHVAKDPMCDKTRKFKSFGRRPQILQHLLLVFEFVGSFALDQVGLLNLDPLHCLNSRVTKIYMIQIYTSHRQCQTDEAKNGYKLITSSKLMTRKTSEWR